MSEEIINEEQTPEYTPPRDIHHLMGLKTYQGMSDEEIEIIINYRASLRAAAMVAEFSDATIIEQQERYIEVAQQNKEQAQSNFERACGRINFKTGDFGL